MSNNLQREFKCGQLNLLLDNGFIRYIKYGQDDVLRMVYYAIRDHNWGTINQEIADMKIHEDDSGFSIEYLATTVHDQIKFDWNCKIEGYADEITFEINGRSNSEFKRNRIGFCILHPIEECSGQQVVIGHPDGSSQFSKFPKEISPNQPFVNISSMHWYAGNTEAILEMEGEIFETEDQRNWLDASYKTYCTPLEIPFPVEIKQGDTIHQKLTLTLAQGDHSNQTQVGNADELLIHEGEYAVPAIGLEANDEVASNKHITLLNAMKLDHVRVEVKPNTPDWGATLENKLTQARALDLSVELVAFVSNNNYVDILSYDWKGIRFSSIILLDEEKVTGSDTIKQVLPEFKKCFPNVPTGIGTDYYFTELNRMRPSTDGADFLSFSTNPQVHAFDELSIIETAQTFHDMVDTCRSFSNGLPVHISPITLRTRSNPNATEVLSPEQEKAIRIDQKQKEQITAQWFLAGFKHLSQAGTKSITCFQTLGEEGLMMPDRESSFANFKAHKNELFPIYYALKALAGLKDYKLVNTTSSQPLKFEGMIFQKGNQRQAVLINFIDEPISIRIGKDIVELAAEEIKTVSIT